MSSDPLAPEPSAEMVLRYHPDRSAQRPIAQAGTSALLRDRDDRNSGANN
jgi:hypothetical protein